MMCVHRLAAMIVISTGVCATHAADPPASQPAATQDSQRPQSQDTKAARSAPGKIQLLRDVVYAQAPGRAGKLMDLKMDTACLNSSEGKPRPAVVYIHGGGWKYGSKEMGLRASLALAHGGYFAVTINYRLTGDATYPAAVHDCKAAIRYLRAHAGELGIDPDRIGVWGHSAGGPLAALLGTSGNSKALDGDVGPIDPSVSSVVQCVVDISGPTDLSVDFSDGLISQWLGGPVNEHQDLAKQASPMTYIDAQDPPLLIIHGTDDPLVDMQRHSEAFHRVLKQAGVEVELLPVPNAGHVITTPSAYVKAAEFFDAHLGGKAATAIAGVFEDQAVRPTSIPQPPAQGASAPSP